MSAEKFAEEAPGRSDDPGRATPFSGAAGLPIRFVLSNGRYGLLFGEDGVGFSWFERWGLTAWSRDRAAGRSGFHFYLRDRDDERVWSAGRRPVAVLPDRYEVRREPGRVILHRRDGDLEAVLEICVHAARPLELRRLRLRNHGPRPRRVEVTTYAEVALHEPPAHDGHPAFSRLFVRTEYEPAAGALLFRRRPRGEGESFPWLVHALAGPGRPLAWETDRARFLGRGRDASAPRAVCGPEPLSGATGDVLDPVMALRVELALAAGEEAERVFLLGADASRAGALELARVVADGAEAAGVFADAARAEEARLGRLGLSLQAAGELETLAGAILYGEPAVRPDGSLRPSIAALRAEPGVVRPSRVSFAPRRAFVMDRPRSAAARADLRAAAGYWDVLGLPIDLVQRGTGGALSIHPVAPADALADPAERPERRS